jgi:RNA polymerase sigma-70 factor (ECF subfamily)
VYQDVLFSHAGAVLGDADLAQDAVQESFIKAFQNITNFRGGSFRAWLLKITTNCCYDLMRRSRRRPSLPLLPEDDQGAEIDSPAWLADPDASVQDKVEANALAGRLYGIIEELPADYRSVLMLVDVYALDYEEAGKVLGIPLGTVKSRLARARLQMRRRLQGALKIPVKLINASQVMALG